MDAFADVDHLTSFVLQECERESLIWRHSG